MKTIVIGKRSNLSKSLSKKIKNSKVFSILDLKKKIKIFDDTDNHKINLIINSFYPSFKLSKKKIDLKEFFDISVNNLFLITNFFKKFKINKIIYSSSSSIYNIPNIKFTNKVNIKELQAVTKFLCEKILIDFSKKKEIDLIIARIFNIYGGNDNFSFINKIMNLKKTDVLSINNNGEAIRDFIHIDEVVQIYEHLLKKKKTKQIYQIGKGYGYKILDLIDFVECNKQGLINKKIDEQEISIADKKELVNLKLLKYELKDFLSKKKYRLNNKYLDKYYYNNQSIKNDHIKKSIIYGAGNAGKQLCSLILKNNSRGVFCFVDENKKLIGKNYKGIKIISKEDLFLISKTKKISDIIIAIPSLTNLKLKKIFNELGRISNVVSNLPLKSELNTNIIKLSDVQNSEFLHIFEKDDYKTIDNNNSKLKNKNILITGAGGSIGSELVFQLSRITNKKIVCLDFSELFLFELKNNPSIDQKKINLILGDINDENLLKKLIQKNKIDLIFHAAAYKHLNFLEQNPLQAIKNNILGTYNIIQCALKFSPKKIKIINISTDKAVRPTSILGISKRISEIICQSYVGKKSKIEISTVRFGNVFGSKGSVINLFIEKINNGDEIYLTSKKAKRFFMSINQACSLVIAASQINESFKTFILDMGKPVNIYDLLKKLIKLKTKNNKKSNLKIIETRLNKGEKISEELTINKYPKKTKINKILTIEEPSYKKKLIDKLMEKILSKLETYKAQDIINDIKLFLKNEIKKN